MVQDQHGQVVGPGRAGEAGLVDIELIVKPRFVEATVNSQDPQYKAVGGALPAGARIGDYVASVNLAARRPWR